MATSALGAVLHAILDKKEEVTRTSTISSAKGTVSFNSQQDRDLFNLMQVILAIDPQRGADLLEKRPELKSAAERFPLGVASMAGEKEYLAMSWRTQQKRDPQAEASDRLNAIARSRVAEATAVLQQDPQKALDLARGVPVPEIRADLLAIIARRGGDQDPSTFQGVLNQLTPLLEEIKDPGARVRAWDLVAESAHRAKQEQRAWEAMGRALEAAAELYQRDTDADNPNLALRDQWPSAQAYRRLVSQAATLFGFEAEVLLVRIMDPDMALLARIEMARALLGRSDANRITAEYSPARRR